MFSYFFEKIILYLDNKSQNNNLNFIKKVYGRNLNIIFDIGCHEGETIDLIKKKFCYKKIYAFDPNKDLVNKLMTKHCDVDFINKAVGEKRCKKTYFKSQFSAINTLNKINQSSDYYRKKSRIISLIYPKKSKNVNNLVDVISLKEFMGGKKIKSVDLVKIDTEGYEFFVLKGIGNYLKNIKMILFEHHYDNSLLKNYKFSDINFLLDKNGFYLAYKSKMMMRNIFEYIYLNSNYFKK